MGYIQGYRHQYIWVISRDIDINMGYIPPPSLPDLECNILLTKCIQTTDRVNAILGVFLNLAKLTNRMLMDGVLI